MHPTHRTAHSCARLFTCAGICGQDVDARHRLSSVDLISRCDLKICWPHTISAKRCWSRVAKARDAPPRIIQTFCKCLSGLDFSGQVWASSVEPHREAWSMDVAEFGRTRVWLTSTSNLEEPRGYPFGTHKHDQVSFTFLGKASNPALHIMRLQQSRHVWLMLELETCLCFQRFSDLS